MARRKTLWTPEIVRQRIQTTQLLKRVQAHALGDAAVKMKPSQLKAALFLLSRVVCQPNEGLDLNVNGALTVLMDDPTQRPPAGVNGYHRRPVDRQTT